MFAKVTGFLKRPSTAAFGVFALVYAACMAGIFWGTWSLDRAPVEPDTATYHAVDDAARWFAEVVRGKDFVPSDLMHIVGGMYFWQELQYALAGFLAALGIAFYLRGRGCSHLAAYAGGGAFGLSGYVFTLFSAGHLGWFVWLMYGPFAFGLTDRAVRKGRWLNWALLGGVLAWASARQPDLWLMFTLLTAAYGVWCLWREMRDGATARAGAGARAWWARRLAGVALCAGAALAAGLPQFGKAIFHDLAGREKQIAETTGAPAADGGKVAKANEERWLFCTSWSLPPEDTLEFIVPDVHGGSSDPRVSPKNPYKGRLGQQMVVPASAAGQRHPVTGQPLKAGERIWLPYRQHSLYFGLITVLFAALGCVGAFRLRGEKTFRDAPFWIAAAGVAYLCALGGFTPFYRLVFALPFGDAIRCPVKFVHLLECCAAVLAGLGFEACLRRFKRTPTPASRVLALALAALAVLNVIDLARVDARYCAVEDVSFYRAPNAAAADIAAHGGGSVYVAVPERQGGGMIRTSLGLHGAQTAEKPDAARFILASGDTLRDPALAGRLKTCKHTASYSLSARTGIARAAASPALALFLDPAVPAPPAPTVPYASTLPPPSRLSQLLTALSVLTTFTLLTLALRHTLTLPPLPPLP